MESKKVKLINSYVKFIEAKNHSFFGHIFYFFLFCLSLLYGLVVLSRDFLYRKKIIPSYRPKNSFILGVGNISWAGTGKTSFSLLLYEHFLLKFKTAILRRGYGEDEEKLIRQKGASVFSAINRKELVRKLENTHQLFILDDAFQYRGLSKDIEIVIMGYREFERKCRLIPASYFRETIRSLRRADILIVNYTEEANRERVKKIVSRFILPGQIYFASYHLEFLEDLVGKRYPFSFLLGKRVAAFAAIGYPQGFFCLLEKTGITLEQKIIYPDHYNLSVSEYRKLEESLLGKGVNFLIITEKDKYHLPLINKKLNIIILKVKLKIEDENRLLDIINNKIAAKLEKSQTK